MVLERNITDIYERMRQYILYHDFDVRTCNNDNNNFWD